MLSRCYCRSSMRRKWKIDRKGQEIAGHHQRRESCFLSSLCIYNTHQTLVGAIKHSKAKTQYSWKFTLDTKLNSLVMTLSAALPRNPKTFTIERERAREDFSRFYRQMQPWNTELEWYLTRFYDGAITNVAIRTCGIEMKVLQVIQ